MPLLINERMLDKKKKWTNLRCSGEIMRDGARSLRKLKGVIQGLSIRIAQGGEEEQS